MAEKNLKLSSFEKEKIDTLKKIVEYKLSPEANIVSIFYAEPETMLDTNIVLDDFTNNTWRVFFQIAHDLIIVEGKKTLDEITTGLYLEKHPKLRAKYDEYGGWETLEAAKEYVKVENLDGYIKELKKWKVCLQLVRAGFPVKDRLSDFVDMSAEEIYAEFETFLNHVFINIDTEVKSYNAFEGIHQLVSDLNEGEAVGMPLYNAPLLTNEIAGFNRGNIYGIGASSGVGKSTMAFNYIVPSAIEHNKKAVFIINEEDEKKFKKELLIWVANNIFKEDLQKYQLRNGNFNNETMELLKKCADWIEKRKEDKVLTVIPLERYSVNIAIKIINKYSALMGGDNDCIFVLDTLKESFDAKTDEIYKSMMRDMVALYDTVKPSAKNVPLIVTYQLGKASLKMRHLTNNEIGQSKSIVDVMSVNIMMRRPYEDEYEGGKNELSCWRLDGINKKSKVTFKLKKEDNPMITSITKNRFGMTDAYCIVSSCDLSRNVCKDIGYCFVEQDY